MCWVWQTFSKLNWGKTEWRLESKEKCKKKPRDSENLPVHECCSSTVQRMSFSFRSALNEEVWGCDGFYFWWYIHLNTKVSSAESHLWTWWVSWKRQFNLYCYFRSNSNTVWWFLKEEKDIDELIIRFLGISVHSEEDDFLKNLGHHSSNQM